MNIVDYLDRINFEGIPSIDLNTLIKLHECHVYTVPFENLDIQYKTKIKLEKEHLCKKIIENKRGGFCYELNYMFWFLLKELGFNVKMISAQIFNGEEYGPPFDHMSLVVQLSGKNWLADVGFGDLFVKPIDLSLLDNQFDGRNYFKIKNWDKTSFLLSMSKNGVDYEKKYLFKIDGEKIENFCQQCLFKQQSPSSYFVKNKIMTLPVTNGRKTIFNSKYLIKKNNIKTEYIIENKKEEERILKEEFSIRI